MQKSYRMWYQNRATTLFRMLLDRERMFWVRVWVQDWEVRQKLLLFATLAYAFLLHVLDPPLADLCAHLLRVWCHRTGKRYRQAALPYRFVGCGPPSVGSGLQPRHRVCISLD